VSSYLKGIDNKRQVPQFSNVATTLQG